MSSESHKTRKIICQDNVCHFFYFAQAFGEECFIRSRSHNPDELCQEMPVHALIDSTSSLLPGMVLVQHAQAQKPRAISQPPLLMCLGYHASAGQKGRAGSIFFSCIAGQVRDMVGQLLEF